MLTHEHVAQEIDRLFRKALKKEGVDGLKDLLGFMQRFRRFSAWNAAMIRLQRPGAGPVATTRQWNDAGRSVSPDAIPIVIRAVSRIEGFAKLRRTFVPRAL